jgi:hypothetical protein
VAGNFRGRFHPENNRSPSPISTDGENMDNEIDYEDAQRVIERGHRAETLLANEAFAWVVNDLTTMHLAALVAADPGTPQGQEEAHSHHVQQHALTGIVEALTGYVAAGREQQEILGLSDPEEPDSGAE